MANMQPQTPDLNRHVWEKLEVDSCRLALKGNTLFILAGYYGKIKTIGKEQHRHRAHELMFTPLEMSRNAIGLTFTQLEFQRFRLVGTVGAYQIHLV